ncbi:Asp-tRNA(Asn)/Glu-tRNA(Gln) amidotransferase subunit GatB [Desulfobacula toluolica]|uniref:Aspartyl/glutamyl-tRNA(Asn/Gln) amidotransferase subunit B n=1 Tax=Desulfobacula toluolica (strain DSM 7467 / Tol2) TaxID=651182 RepID=K0NEH6_DESTT|nr:Asp-tRNA(Asn)/Glu-tRNA(Gln) amidotransferase subunit GatB [Desulfobacula toluolica]CCK79310.1 GatB: glutamyl-tRNA(Gln) amidotransferase, subunit B [Desulfobacula toluolica Tol2]
MKYEAVIGLEIHIQLNSATKIFCDCANTPGDDPNTNVCPVCLWLPGALPVLSREVLEKATLACLALNCEIQSESAFDQKVYYYPDLPKGFQLSQAHKPLARKGWVEIQDEQGNPKKLRLHHVHMEEDVAKLVHETEGRLPISLVDFNRAGTPLVEVVTEPELKSPYDAMEFLKAIRNQVRYTGCAECSMESGTMRCDANISIRPEGSDQLNTKVEVKNMNSIHHVGDAIAYEIKRQIEAVNNNEPIILHTRLWDPEKHVTTAMRAKFEGPCIPDPSVPMIVLTDSWLEKIKALLPEMPGHKVKRFVQDYALTRDEAVLMSSERGISEFFESVVTLGAPARMTAGWMATQLLPALKAHGQTLADTSVTPERFAGLIQMLEKNEINSNSAKSVLEKLFDTDGTPQQIVDQFGFRQVSDTTELAKIVDKIIFDNESAVTNYKNGNKKSMGFLVGQAMKVSKGKANPKLVQEMIKEQLA